MASWVRTSNHTRVRITAHNSAWCANDELGAAGRQRHRRAKVVVVRIAAQDRLLRPVNAAVALIDVDGRVLISKRPDNKAMGGMWEFPGGKQEPGEPIRDTISRELREELAIEVSVEQELVQVDHAYSHKKLRFVVHLCDLMAGKPQPLCSQQVRWVQPNELENYAFPAANTKIIESLLTKLAEAE